MGKRQGRRRKTIKPKTPSVVTKQATQRSASKPLRLNNTKIKSQNLFQASLFYWRKCQGPFAGLWLVLGAPATFYGAWTTFEAIWPVPSFLPGCPSVDDPFNIPFKVENNSAWLDIYDLEIECMLRPAQFSDENGNIRYFDKTTVSRASTSTLTARGYGHYTCPVQETIGSSPDVFFMHPGFHLDSAVIQFSSSYSILHGLMKVSSDPSVFSLHAKTMPRQWMKGLPIY